MTMIDDAAAILKEVYIPGRVEDLSLKDHAFLATLPKNTNVGTPDDMLVTPVIFGEAVPRSATFTNAQTYAGTGRAVTRFLQPTYDDYAVVQIPRKLLKGTQDKIRAFMEAKVLEFDGALQGLGDSISHALYRDGTGRIASGVTVSGSTVTLPNREDMRFIFKGQKIQASNADGTDPADTLLDSGAVITVATINREAGSFTFTGSITGFNTGDSIFGVGDFRAKLPGLDAIMPKVRSGTPTLWGVTQYSDWDRLAGLLVDVSSKSVKDGLIAMRTEMALFANRARPKYAYINPSRWADLEIELGSALRYTEVQTQYGFGVRAIEMMSSKGPLTVMADADCDVNDAFLIDPDTWELASIGPVPDIHDDDGVTMLRVYNQDALELRGSYYAALRPFAPGHNCRGSFTAL